MNASEAIRQARERAEAGKRIVEKRYFVCDRLHQAPFDRVEIMGRLRAIERGGFTSLERELLLNYVERAADVPRLCDALELATKALRDVTRAEYNAMTETGFQFEQRVNRIAAAALSGVAGVLGEETP